MSFMSVLRLESVSKCYGSVVALSDVSLDFAPWQVTALIGRSGCGKSTLLRLLNGLEQPERGRVHLFGVPLDYGSLPRLRRRIGYAVQGTGLFPHLSVRDNIALLAQVEKWPAAEIEPRLEQLMGLMDIPLGLQTRFPHELSGGQQQRVGLCRAMMLRPEVLLLDEPFAAIDPLTRLEIQRHMLELHRAEPVTTVLVTHDMSEALLLADHIVVMQDGAIIRREQTSDLRRKFPDAEPNSLLLSLMAGERE
jgi:osmoprotectant transport system ATP-binding protein